MSETLLLENALIVTGSNNGIVIPRGHLLIEGNRISKIEKGTYSGSADRKIDCNGCVVIPGLITAHTHLYGILLRGAALDIEPPTDFAQILQRVWWPVDLALSIDDAYASSLAASADMLRNGSTFFADTYSGPNSIESSLDAVARGAREVGMRGMLAFELTERRSEEEGERGLQEGVRFAKKVEGDPLISCMLSIHASFTVTDDIIAETVDNASKMQLPLTVHTSEGLVDLYHNLENYGERTVERLHRMGVLSDRTILAHCVHVNRRELELIQENNTSVAHNPMSNMLNAVGTSPVPEMLEMGITVGLGNDGWIYDPFENMRCAMTVHRLKSGNPSIIGPSEVFHMATLGGAKCYGLEDEIGSLEEGKLADIVILNGERIPTPLRQDTVIGHLVNSFGGRDVRDVLVNGEMVIENYKMAKIEDHKVSEVSMKSAEKLWARIE